jgi:hypothetical protein
MRFLWTLSWIALLSQGAVAQQPRLASIDGIVVERDSGVPIGRANVELRRTQARGANTSSDLSRLQEQLDAVSSAVVVTGGTSGGTAAVAPTSRLATTGSDGRFVIRDIPPGEYRLYATRSNGHIPGEYGQRSASGAGVPFTIAAGQRMTGVSLTMTPTASITGRVVDAAGEPSGYAHVQALKAVYRDGRRTLTVMQLVQADERGAYRLFWLPPGEYYVCAKPLDLRRSSEMMHIPPPSRFGTYEQQMRPTVTAVNTSETLDDGRVVEGQYVPIYFPGTRDEQDASPVSVRAGDNINGVDINVAGSLVRTHRVRGTVIDGSTGQPLAASLQIIPRNPPAILLIATGEANQNGSFDVWGALPGADYLIANVPRGSGLLAVDVDDGDVNGVTVTVWPPTAISGQIRLARSGPAGTDTDLAGLTVTLRRNPWINGLPDASSLSGPQVRVSPDGRVISTSQASPGNTSSADGSFRLNNVSPGDYTVVVAGKSDAYLEAITFGGRDVLRSGLRVNGPAQGQLEIVVSTNSGSVEGSVVAARREPVARATVVAIPDAGRRGRTDLYKVGSTDSAGRFQLSGLAPGTYELFAWEEIESGAWHDPDVVRAAAGRSRMVQIAEGSRGSVELTLIPAER